MSSEISLGLTNMSAFLDNPILERLPLRTLGYKDYIERVKDLCIQVNTKTQIAFINPDYKYLLIHNNSLHYMIVYHHHL